METIESTDVTRDLGDRPYSTRKGLAVDIKRIRRHLAVLAALVGVALLPGCGSTESTGSGGSESGGSVSRTTGADYPGSRSGSTDHDRASRHEHSSVYTIWGQVTIRETGEPYEGATVEFRNLWGYNVHMDTDVNGEYSLPAPADVYTAFALDLDNMSVDFDVVGRSSNVVEVPPSGRVDFEAYPN
jgi:hypothetical protein